jgi:pimeloyl-ACP methyl ester carboxylesterase
MAASPKPTPRFACAHAAGYVEAMSTPAPTGLSPLAAMVAAVAFGGLIAVALIANLALRNDVTQLTIGDRNQPQNLAIFIPGSGCEPAAAQARAFFTGIEGHWRVLVREKPGLRMFQPFGCTAAFRAEARMDLLIARQTQFAKASLAAFPDAPIKMLVGYSEGGLAAPFVARDAPGFTHLLVAASGAMPGDELVHQMGVQLSGAQKANRRIAAIEAAPRALDRFVWDDTYAYLGSLMRLQPLSAYADLDLPIYMLHGADDQDVPPRAAEMARSAFDAAGKSNLTLKVARGYGHRLGFDSPPAQLVLWSGIDKWLAEPPQRREKSSHQSIKPADAKL